MKTQDPTDAPGTSFATGMPKLEERVRFQWDETDQSFLLNLTNTIESGDMLPFCNYLHNNNMMML